MPSLPGLQKKSLRPSLLDKLSSSKLFYAVGIVILLLIAISILLVIKSRVQKTDDKKQDSSDDKAQQSSSLSSSEEEEEIPDDKQTLKATDLNSYTNDTFMISIAIPDGWKAEVNKNEVGITILSFKNEEEKTIFEIQDRFSDIGPTKYDKVKKIEFETQSGKIKLKEFSADKKVIWAAAPIQPSGYLKYYKALTLDEKFVLSTLKLNTRRNFVSDCYVYEKCDETGYYKNDKLKFKIKIPETWTVNDRQNEDGIYIVSFINEKGVNMFEIQEAFTEVGSLAYQRINKTEIKTASGKVLVKEYLDLDKVLWASGSVEPSGFLYYYNKPTDEVKSALETFQSLKDGDFGSRCYVYEC